MSATLHAASFVHPRSPFPARPSAPLAGGEASADVLVLGAGMAGLSAAYELVRAGQRVTVLEATDRVGGRVHTLREPFAGGLHAEAGAMFLPAHHTLTIGYAEHFGLPLVPLVVPPPLYYVGGQRILDANDPNAPWPMALTPAEQQGGVKGLWMQYLLPLVMQDFGDPRAAGWPPPALAPLAGETFDAMLAARGASPGAAELAALGYFDAWGDGAAWAAALPLLRDLCLSTDGFPPQLTFHADPVPAAAPADVQVVAKDEAALTAAAPPAPTGSFSIQGGNDRLPQAFAASPELAGRIRFRTVVRAIEWDDARVRVHGDTPSGRQTFEAAHAICTIPFSVLRSVELRGPLSWTKRRAIARLEYASVCRTYVQATTRFWEPLKISPTAVTDLPVMLVNHQTMAQDGPQAILESYASGANARAFGAMTEEENVRQVGASLATVFGADASVFERGTRWDWDAQPYARGAYAWFLPGDLTVIGPSISQPEGRLHFAGEHASVLPGWIQGALESGMRAVGEVLQGGGGRGEGGATSG